MRTEDTQLSLHTTIALNNGVIHRTLIPLFTLVSKEEEESEKDTKNKMSEPHYSFAN